MVRAPAVGVPVMLLEIGRRSEDAVLFDRAGCHTPSLEAPAARDGLLAVARPAGEDRSAP
ncbi:hypothetical protein [Streptomyces somaliensis]|uniref:hypothetical protein n=1 Tax=Streptomyces somaliensis TaxID=78355 RepID=UPI0034E9617B|nr:hypothetical protein [Streptomyces somaliensis]